MSFTDVMYGGLGQLNNQFQANLGQNAAMNQQNQYAAQQAQASYAAQQAQLAALYGGGGFGGQTAYYAGLGADYGRATGGFGGLGAANADPFTPVGGGGGLNPNDPANIALWYQIMGGGGAAPGPASPSGLVTSGGSMPGYQLDPTPGVGAGGGYDPYATQNPFGGGGGATLPGGGINPNDPGNIAAYWAIMQGGGGGMPSTQSVLGYTPDQYLGASPYNDAAGLGGAYPSPYTGGALATLPGGGINPNDPGNIAAYWAIMQGRGGGMPSTQSVLGYTPDQYLGGPDYAGAGQFDPNSFANRFSAGGYYNPGTPAQVSGVASGGYNPLSGAQPPYTYQPGMVQGMGGPGDWVRQQIPGMQTLSPNDMTYQPSVLVNGNAGG